MDCPNCGLPMRFDNFIGQWICNNCGYDANYLDATDDFEVRRTGWDDDW